VIVISPCEGSTSHPNLSRSAGSAVSWLAGVLQYPVTKEHHPMSSSSELCNLPSPANAAALAPFVHQRNILLTTYRRDGTPVGTPVNIAVEGDRAFIRTWETAGKMKRMRRNPEVTIAPSTLRGTPTGAALRAHARLLGSAESDHAARLLTGKHPLLQGILVPLAHRLAGYRTVHLELTPVVD
jgi:PPOX class probable F420-dependent enzyme